MSTKLSEQMKEINPKVMYYGTPVVLLSTLNEDGTTNISPISSSWALGKNIILGIGVGGKALENLERHRECVINLPDPSLWGNVEKLASLTGVKNVPVYKKAIGFTYEKNKFGASELTSLTSQTVIPERIKECPIQIEAKVNHIRIPEYDPFFAIVETEAIHFHASESIIHEGNYINPSKWSPLIYNFRHYFGLGNELGRTFRA